LTEDGKRQFDNHEDNRKGKVIKFSLLLPLWQSVHKCAPGDDCNRRSFYQVHRIHKKMWKFHSKRQMLWLSWLFRVSRENCGRYLKHITLQQTASASRR